MPSRGRRRLGRALVFIGAALWVPELYIIWVLLETLFTPLHGPGGQAAQIHIHLNPSAWAAMIGWTALCWGLIAWGVRVIRHSK
jgi:hypothetical protein